MSARQGSASYTIVIGALGALLVGALVLTVIVYPLYNAFTTSAFWGAETLPGSRVVTFTGGLWAMWGLIILLAVTVYVWVETRQ